MGGHGYYSLETGRREKEEGLQRGCVSIVDIANYSRMKRGGPKLFCFHFCDIFRAAIFLFERRKLAGRHVMMCSRVSPSPIYIIQTERNRQTWPEGHQWKHDREREEKLASLRHVDQSFLLKRAIMEIPFRQLTSRIRYLNADGPDPGQQIQLWNRFSEPAKKPSLDWNPGGGGGSFCTHTCVCPPPASL